jgi:hypothetical protein
MAVLGIAYLFRASPLRLTTRHRQHQVTDKTADTMYPTRVDMPIGKSPSSRLDQLIDAGVKHIFDQAVSWLPGLNNQFRCRLVVHIPRDWEDRWYGCL